MKKRRFGIILASAVVTASVVLSGCGASGSTKDAYMATESAMEAPSYGVYEEAASMDMADNKMAGSEAGEVVDTSNRKLITTVNLSAETDDLDSTVNEVERKVKELGGYIESSNVYNGSGSYRSSRSASLTARIPATRLDEFVESIEGSNNIVSKSVNVDDVTLSYVDIESRKNSLKTEEKRLLEILEKAETVEDIITIEDKLANVRYELESIESQLRSYDNRVDYSTVYLDIDEVAIFTPVEKEGAFARMGKGFMQSLKDVAEGLVEFCVWFVTHIPQIIVLIIVVLIFILIGRALIIGGNKRRAKKAAKMQAKYGAAPQPQNMTNAVNVQTPQPAAPNVGTHVDVSTPEDKGNNGNQQ